MCEENIRRFLAAVLLAAAAICPGVASAGPDLRIAGTVEYVGAQGPVSAARPIVVIAARSRVLDGIPVAVAVVTDNGGAFELTVPEAGDYYLAYALDTNGDGVPNVGDPYGIYQDRIAAPADEIAVPVSGDQTNLQIQFGDTAGLPGVTGTVTYTGDLGPVSDTTPIRVQVFRQGELTDRVNRQQRIVANGGSYEFLLWEARQHYMEVFLDLNDDDVLDPGEPFEIYPDRYTPPGDPLPQGQASVDVVFGDGPDPTPTPIPELSIAGSVTYDGSLAVVSEQNPIMVIAFSDAELREDPVNGAFVSENGGSFAIAVPAPGDYHLVMLFDADGDRDASVGDPYEIYPDLFETPAGTLTAPVAGVELSFDDSARLQGVRGQVFYHGRLGDVTVRSPIRMDLFRDQSVMDRLTHCRVLTENGEPFQFIHIGRAPQYLVTFLDLDDNGSRDPGEPFTIYDGRSEAPADPLPENAGDTPLDVSFADDAIPAPTPTAAVATPTPTPAPAACVGDCNGDGVTSVNELVTGVDIALELFGIGSCRAFDTNGDERVEVNELIQGVDAALNGCPQAVTASSAGIGRGR